MPWKKVHAKVQAKVGNKPKPSIIYEPATEGHKAVGAWFLGPQGENSQFMKDALNYAIDSHIGARKGFFPTDGAFITPDMQASETFKVNMKFLREQLTEVCDLLAQHSVPFWSSRYSAHMVMESTMPSVLGYLATILYNPNNVTVEASTITTVIEKYVGEQLCTMLGYNLNSESTLPVAWGHITSGGTVANIESMWAARNLKFYPLSLRNAMKDGEPLAFIAPTFKVDTCDSRSVLFKDMTTWELLNIKVADILDMSDRLFREYGISPTYLGNVMKVHSIQTVGKDQLEKDFNITKPCQYLLSNTKHYSWPKGAAIVGIGSENVVDVPVDTEARLNSVELEKLLRERKDDGQAVFAVVAIAGSTEEGSVDPLDEILAIRTRLEQEGMTFVVHVDAAWGGYFASLLEPKKRFHRGREFVPTLKLKASVLRTIEKYREADSVTVDPHKTGYIPYQAGGLCYKDGRMRFLNTWSTAYITRGPGSETIGIYGLEGSKAGAAAVAVYLSHKVIGLNPNGYGVLLGEALYTASRLAAYWAAMPTAESNYVIVPLNYLPSEEAGGTPQEVEEERQYIRDHILGKSNTEIATDSRAMEILTEIGSDLIINVFACNFRLPDGTLNDDIEEANLLNRGIVENLSVTSSAHVMGELEFYLASTEFKPEEYGACVTRMKRKLGLSNPDDDSTLFVLRNAVMSPFQTSGDFVSRLAEVFERVVTEEVADCHKRLTIHNQTHYFVIQGTENLFLVHRPNFTMKNSRQQLILQAELAPADMQAYVAARAANPGSTFFIRTATETTLEHILSTKTADRTFVGIIGIANLQNDGTYTMATLPTLPATVKVHRLREIKQRRLERPYRDPAYPTAGTPFYLYGTPTQAHLDHILVASPNTHLSAENVTLELEPPITSLASQLNTGAILMVTAFRESLLQPFPLNIDMAAPNGGFFFKPGREFDVVVYKDPVPAGVNGPGLVNVTDADKLAVGKLKLVANQTQVFADSEALNKDPFFERKRPEKVPWTTPLKTMHKTPKPFP